jgi:uncharacterized membrane protein
MDADKQTLLILYVVFGLILAALSVPLLREKVRPNWFYGFRVPKTLNNPQVWYAANKFAAKRLLWSGATLVVAATGLYYLAPALSLDAYALGCLAIFAAVFVPGLIQSFFYLRSL